MQQVMQRNKATKPQTNQKLGGGEILIRGVCYSNECDVMFVYKYILT